MVYGQKKQTPLKVGVIGLTHSHVHWIFGCDADCDIEIVGIVEKNEALAQKYADQYNFSMDLVFSSMEELFDHSIPEAVTAFGSTFEHLEVVQKAAPRGIHVMVEKPLAVNMDHAKQMKALADKFNIHLLTNYETTWYPTTHKTYDLAKKTDAIGSLRKIIVNDGHKGPKKIGVNQEFLVWLTDPVKNGGGADFDFGCYGANLLTWFMEGQRPNSVTAVAKQLQAENNPKVEDESIIIVQYDDLVAIIQGSWNWPIGRKDMEIYGLKGALYADNRNDLRIRIAKGYDEYDETKMTLNERPKPFNNPFAFLASVVKNEQRLAPYDLSSLENNLIVIQILEAARKSAKNGKTIVLK